DLKRTAHRSFTAATEGAMNLYENILDLLSDDRFFFNLIAVHVLLAFTLIASIVIRWVLVRGGDHLVRLTGLHWLDGLSKEAVQRARTVLFWLTLGTMIVIVGGGVVYHLDGSDVRHDLNEWYHHFTRADFMHMIVAFVELVAVVVLAWTAVRWIRRLRHVLQTNTIAWLDAHHKDALPTANGHEPQHRHTHLDRWFFLFERYALM